MDINPGMFTDGRIRPFSDEFTADMRKIADAMGEVAQLWPQVVKKVKEPKVVSRGGVLDGKLLETWGLINATVSGGVITTAVAPTSLGDGIFEYKCVPVKITAYAAGSFTTVVDDDPRFAPAVYDPATSVTLLNAPTHENDADWKYAGVNTSAGSDYPAGFSVRGIGENRDNGGGASTWKSVLVKIGRYEYTAGSYLWLLMAEPDHDGTCTAATTPDAFAPFFL